MTGLHQSLGQFKHATYCKNQLYCHYKPAGRNVAVFDAMIGRYVALVYQEVILVESLWA